MDTPVDNYFEQGLEYYESGQYEAAIDLLTKALRLSLGDLAEILVYRGMSYAYLEAYDRAMQDFSAAIDRNPYMADAYNERGSLFNLLGQPERALLDLDAAVRLDPVHYAAYYNRALAHEKLEQIAEAEADLSATIDLNPGVAPAYELRGRIRASQQDYEGAIADLERFLRMGGGREFDNQSEIQSLILSLRMNHFFSRFIPARFLPSVRE